MKIDILSCKYILQTLGQSKKMKYNWYANIRYKNNLKCSIKIRGGKKKVGGEKKEQVQWMTSNYKVAINTTIAVITLNVNGLNKKVKNRCQSG